MRIARRQRYLVVLVLLGTLAAGVSNCTSSKDWRTASRDPAGIAPDPEVVRDPVVQVYGARAWGWRGWFAIHTWIAVKPGEAAGYTVYEVVGWRASWLTGAAYQPGCPRSLLVRRKASAAC